MEAYDVVVRNELTGELVSVGVHSWSARDAQTEALLYMFRERRWRKAVALWPEVIELRHSA